MHIVILFLVLMLSCTSGQGQKFEVIDSSVFVPQHKKIVLLKNPSGRKTDPFQDEFSGEYGWYSDFLPPL
jgi:hypothetical protein